VTVVVGNMTVLLVNNIRKLHTAPEVIFFSSRLVCRTAITVNELLRPSDP